MAEYIEREAALVAISDTVMWDPSDIIENALCNAKKRVRCIPAAKVAPVRHGTWIPRIYRRRMMYYCSLCDHRQSGRPPYCSICGAKMDGEGDQCDGGG